MNVPNVKKFYPEQLKDIRPVGTSITSVESSNQSIKKKKKKKHSISIIWAKIYGEKTQAVAVKNPSAI